MDPETRREHMAGWIKWGLGLVGAIIISPFVFLAIKGIVGLAIAAAIGMLIINLAPILSMKLANMKMKAIIAEAEENPIETMQNIRLEKGQELDNDEQVIVEWETELLNIQDEIGRMAPKYPEDAAMHQKNYDQLAEGLELAKQQVAHLRQELQALTQTIERESANWRVALKMEKVARFDQATQKRIFDEIKQRTSLDAVRNRLNHGFAQMKVTLAKRQGAAVLPGASQVSVIPTAPFSVEKEPAPFPRSVSKQKG